MKRLFFFIGYLLVAVSTHAQVSSKTGSENGHEWVDLGLSVKWATCNVGAVSPEGLGCFYAWGEIYPKAIYSWSNCFDCLDDKGDNWSVYKIDGIRKIEPDSGHDTARENWRGRWRMPTIYECEELDGKCTWKWTSKNNVSGFIITGPNGNSIFLPATGRVSVDGLKGIGEYCGYWSSELSFGSSAAIELNFGYSHHHITAMYRRMGNPVRPVIE